jgi:hypothetical protein
MPRHTGCGGWSVPNTPEPNANLFALAINRRLSLVVQCSRAHRRRFQQLDKYVPVTCLRLAPAAEHLALELLPLTSDKFQVSRYPWNLQMTSLRLDCRHIRRVEGADRGEGTCQEDRCYDE